VGTGPGLAPRSRRSARAGSGPGKVKGQRFRPNLTPLEDRCNPAGSHAYAEAYGGGHPTLEDSGEVFATITHGYTTNSKSIWDDPQFAMGNVIW
jgi:hypothetical protein